MPQVSPHPSPPGPLFLPWTPPTPPPPVLSPSASDIISQVMYSNAGVVLSMLRFGPKLALTGLQAPTLTAPFAKVVDQVVTDPWLRKFLDLECFVLR